MKVLLIGGAGYIGAHVTRAMLDAGHQADVYDNFSSGLPENIFPESKVFKADILDYKALVAAMKEGYDAVVHLAALKAVGESMVQPEKYAVNNISGSVNILNAMTESRVNNIIFSSSAAVFGEPQYLPIDEKHPQHPENFYGFTKLEIERLLGWYDRLRGLRAGVLRYFNACGYDAAGRIGGLEKQPANLLPVMMEAALDLRGPLEIFGDDYDTRDGTCIRDYIHVSDLARAHVLALQYINTKNESITLNLGSETGISVKEMYEAACRIVGKTIPMRMSDRRPGDPAVLIAGNRYAAQELNWHPEQSDIDTLIKTTYEAYLKHKKS
jgi:UDP-glucose 4-epimerase